MINLDQIPSLIGYLEVTEDGAVISSTGELENCEQLADVFIKLLSLTDEAGSRMFPGAKGFKRMSVNYDDHCYVVCMSNKKIHIVKRRTEHSLESHAVDDPWIGATQRKWSA